MTTLVERIRMALGEAEETQVTLAAACGISPPSVNDWLSGKTKSLKATSAQRASAFLGVNILWLTEGRGPMRPTGREKHHATAEKDAEVKFTSHAAAAPSIRDLRPWPFDPAIYDRIAALDPDARAQIQGAVLLALAQIEAMSVATPSKRAS